MNYLCMKICLSFESTDHARFLEKSFYLSIISNPENPINRDFLKIKLSQFWAVLYIIFLADSIIFIGTSDTINIQVFHLFRKKQFSENVLNRENSD